MVVVRWDRVLLCRYRYGQSIENNASIIGNFVPCIELISTTELLDIQIKRLCRCFSETFKFVSMYISQCMEGDSVKIMVYCLNLVIVYTLHSGGVEIPFWCGH